MKKIILFPLMILSLSACISAPKGLEADQFTIQNIVEIEADDYQCQCKKVRLGGKIIAATALKDQMKLEVVSLPVSKFSAKPILDSVTDGRFIAYIKGFIDPENLKEQYITVTGVLNTQESGKIDEADYQYPVIQVEHYRRWKLVQEYYYDFDDWDYYRGYRRMYWGGRFGSPFWGAELRLRYNLY